MHTRLRNPFCINGGGGVLKYRNLINDESTPQNQQSLVLVIYILNFNSQKTGSNLQVMKSSCDVTKLSQIYAIFQQN